MSALWSDVWCFTCRHEIRQRSLNGAWYHIDDDDNENCVCLAEDLEHQP